MKFGASIALMAMALVLPASAQHGARGGFSSRGGISSHSGFAGHAGFSGSRGFARPSAPVRNYGFARQNNRFAGQGFQRDFAQRRPAFRVPNLIPNQGRGYQGHRVASARPTYRPGFGDRHRGGDRDRDRHYRPRFGGGYGFVYPWWPGYPGYVGYPYVIDQGFYDWGSTDDAGDAQALAPNYANEPEYGGYDAQPEAQQDPGYATGQPAQVPMARPSYQGLQPYSVSVPEEPLTVMFRNGRAPATMQNYMLNGSTLTDLDRQHYEQIPLNQIDVAATQQANRARGLDFKIPAGPGE